MDRPLACVMGDMDMVRPLGKAGIRCAVVARPRAPIRFSRFVREAIDPEGPSLLDALLGYARGSPEAPVLFYESDWSLQFISANRDALAPAFRFLMPEADLIDDLLDKSRFPALAERLELPAPRSALVSASPGSEPPDLDLSFPVIVKPLPYRDERWERIQAGAEEKDGGGPAALRELSAKVLRADTPDVLRRLWPRLAEARVDFLAQELVPGPETSVESYHVFVDAEGRVAGEFTGRKLRTYPPEFGRSTALVTTDEPDVVALGRDVVERLDFRGVAKVDFKRGPDGRLRLLEVNPRYTLWAHLGAVAGVNLPAIAYAELTGGKRPKGHGARAGVRWCRPRVDAAAAREIGVPFTGWLRWAVSCEINSAFAWDDPMPFLWRKFAERLPGRGRSGLRTAPSG